MAKKSTKTEKTPPSPDDKVQLQVEMPRQMRDEAITKARDEGTTLAVIVRSAIQSYLSGELVFETRLTPKKKP